MPHFLGGSHVKHVVYSDDDTPACCGGSVPFSDDDFDKGFAFLFRIDDEDL